MRTWNNGKVGRGKQQERAWFYQENQAIQRLNNKERGEVFLSNPEQNVLTSETHRGGLGQLQGKSEVQSLKTDSKTQFPFV